ARMMSGQRTSARVIASHPPETSSATPSVGISTDAWRSARAARAADTSGVVTASSSAGVIRERSLPHRSREAALSLAWVQNRLILPEAVPEVPEGGKTAAGANLWPLRARVVHWVKTGTGRALSQDLRCAPRQFRDRRPRQIHDARRLQESSGSPSYDHADESLSIHTRWPGCTGGRCTHTDPGRGTVRRPARLEARNRHAGPGRALEPSPADRAAEDDGRCGRRSAQPRARQAARRRRAGVDRA